MKSLRKEANKSSPTKNKVARQKSRPNIHDAIARKAAETVVFRYGEALKSLSKK